MVRLTPGGSNDSILSFAADAAGRLKPKQIIGICACQPLRIHANPLMYLPYDMIDENRLHIEKEMGPVESRFRSVPQDKATSLGWRSIVEYVSLADYVAKQMRAADLLITAAPEGGSVFDASRQVDVAELVMSAGRPLLLVGEGVDKLDLRSVLFGPSHIVELRPIGMVKSLDHFLPRQDRSAWSALVNELIGSSYERLALRSRAMLDSCVALFPIEMSARAVAGIPCPASQLATSSVRAFASASSSSPAISTMVT